MFQFSGYWLNSYIVSKISYRVISMPTDSVFTFEQAYWCNSIGACCNFTCLNLGKRLFKKWTAQVVHALFYLLMLQAKHVGGHNVRH